MKPQITRCTKCDYEALNWGLEKCSKCEGKLEVLAEYKIFKESLK